MKILSSARELVEQRPWTVELLAALLGLLFGLALMPVLIYAIGSATLGRYEGASVGHQFTSLFTGLQEGSAGAWGVFLGPYALFLLFRGLRAWWRASARFA